MWIGSENVSRGDRREESGTEESLVDTALVILIIICSSYRKGGALGGVVS